MIIARAAVIGLGIGTLMTSAQADAVNQTIVTKQGSKVMIDAIYALKDDCSPGPFPEIKISQMPARGVLQAGAARFPIATDRHCPNVDARSLAISYFPHPNFVGDDVIAATIILPNGQQNTYRWTIKVMTQTQSSNLAASR